MRREQGSVQKTVVFRSAPVEVHKDILSLIGVQEKAVIATPSHKMLYFVPVINLIVVGNESKNYGVISELEDEIGEERQSNHE